MHEFNIQINVCLQGLTIVTHILKEGGKFIAKIFRGKDTSLLYCQVSDCWNSSVLSLLLDLRDEMQELCLAFHLLVSQGGGESVDILEWSCSFLDSLTCIFFGK